jgi:hypothetical protein
MSLLDVEEEEQAVEENVLVEGGMKEKRDTGDTSVSARIRAW